MAPTTNSSGIRRRVLCPSSWRPLVRTGCKREAKITQRAIPALGLPVLRLRKLESALNKASQDRDQELERCDQMFYPRNRNTAKNVYLFTKANKQRFHF